MRIVVKITYQNKDEDWQRLITQTFGSWQQAFKESQKLVNKYVWSKNGKLLNVEIKEIEEIVL